MKLTEKNKTAVKVTTKNLINIEKEQGSTINTERLYFYIRRSLDFLGLEHDDEDVECIAHDLEYEVSIFHTKGSVIFNDYDSNLHEWYNNLTLEKEPFWEKYRRFLIEESSLDNKSINLLDHETLPNILNCLGNPNEKFEGKRLRRGLIIGDVQSGKTSTYIGLICKAADAGYKVIILLAGTTESLRQQTQERVDEGIIGYTYPKDLKSKTGIKVGVGNYTDFYPCFTF